MTGTDRGPLAITGDCYSASYTNALVDLGLDPVVLGDRWGYSWRADPLEPLGDIRLTPLEFGAVVAEWYPLEVRDVRCVDAATCLAWLAADPRRVAIVGVDSYWLPHSPNHQLSHFPHAVALRATGTGQVWLVDGYRGASFAGAVDPVTLVPALDGMPMFTHRHRSLQRENVQLGPTDVLALEIVVQDVGAAAAAVTPEAMLGRLRASCRAHLQTAVTQLGEEYANGPAALHAAADALEAVEPADLRDDQVQYVLSCFASIASQRHLNAAFVDRAAATALPAVASHADGLRTAGRRWITLRNTVYLRRGKGQDLRGRCAARMRELASADAEISADLLTELDRAGVG